MPQFNSPYLDLAIGLGTAFFLLSLLPSAANEAIAMLTRLRAKFLWAYLNQLFTKGDDSANAMTAANRAALAVAPPGAGSTGPDATATSSAPTGKPSAPPVPTSVGTLTRLVLSRDDARPTDIRSGVPVAPTDGAPFVDRLHRQLRPIGLGSSTKKKNPKTTIKHIPAAAFAQALVEAFSSENGAGKGGPDDAQIAQFEGTPFEHTLKTLWASSRSDLTVFRTQLEHWFDTEMSRLSGLYKRVSRWVLFSAAAVVVLVVNLDPIGLSKDLWRDPTRRAAVVDFASGAFSSGSASAPKAATDPEMTAVVTACEKKSASIDANADPDVAAQRFESVKTCAVDALEAQRHLGLLSVSMFEWPKWKRSWSNGNPVGTHVLGLLIDFAALALGAPFWYDLLRRLTGLRRTASRAET